MSLRLGVLGAVIDDDGCLLLSRRSDLNTWALPGGRLDPHETLETAVIREVVEETGVTMRVERAVGLYYFDGWQRLNILYSGSPVSGDPLKKTRETRANRYFSRVTLPPDVVGAKDALRNRRPQPRAITTTRRDLWRLRLRFGWRWLVNRVTGRPEPKFPEFNVRAVAVIWGDASRRALTLPGPGFGAADSAAGFRMLPRVVCDGATAPWAQLTAHVERIAGVTASFQWVGIWQDVERGLFELIFAAVVRESDLPGAAQWTRTRNAAFSDRDAAYVERVKPASYAHDPVWSLLAQDDLAGAMVPGALVAANTLRETVL